MPISSNLVRIDVVVRCDYCHVDLVGPRVDALVQLYRCSKVGSVDGGGYGSWSLSPTWSAPDGPQSTYVQRDLLASFESVLVVAQRRLELRQLPGRFQCRCRFQVGWTVLRRTGTLLLLPQLSPSSISCAGVRVPLYQSEGRMSLWQPLSRFKSCSMSVSIMPLPMMYAVWSDWSTAFRKSNVAESVTVFELPEASDGSLYCHVEDVSLQYTAFRVSRALVPIEWSVVVFDGRFVLEYARVGRSLVDCQSRQ